MADISREIEAFREAIYGQEVRSSMISLAEKVNGESEEAVAASEENARTRPGKRSNSGRKSRGGPRERGLHHRKDRGGGRQRG